MKRVHFSDLQPLDLLSIAPGYPLFNNIVVAVNDLQICAFDFPTVVDVNVRNINGCLLVSDLERNGLRIDINGSVGAVDNSCA